MVLEPVVSEGVCDVMTLCPLSGLAGPGVAAPQQGQGWVPDRKSALCWVMRLRVPDGAGCRGLIVEALGQGAGPAGGHRSPMGGLRVV